jgi:hypothetical protein
MADLSDREKTPISRSLTALERLYAVLVGLALTNGVRHLGDYLMNHGAAALVSSQWIAAAACYLGLALTVVPFYNGVNTHLDKTYRFYPDDRPPQPKWLAFEFLLLFVEAALFFAMSQSLFKPKAFAVFALALFCTDVIWALLVRFCTTASDDTQTQVHDWLIRNGVTVLITGAILFASVMTSDLVTAIALGVVLVVRTVFDYMKNGQAYFDLRIPDLKGSSTTNPAPRHEVVN